MSVRRSSNGPLWKAIEKRERTKKKTTLIREKRFKGRKCKKTGQHKTAANNNNAAFAVTADSNKLGGNATIAREWRKRADGSNAKKNCQNEEIKLVNDKKRANKGIEI